MTFERSNLGFFITFLLIGAILGSALGTLLAKFIPGAAIINQSLTAPIGFSLEIISFSLKLNLASIVGLIAGIIIYRKV